MANDSTDRLRPRWFGPMAALVTLLVCVSMAELALRLLWRNPFAGEHADRVLELRMQHPGRDLPVDRSALRPDDPMVRFRTDRRGYILPSTRFSDPQLTLVFLGGSTTECSAVREELRFPALVSTLLEERGIRANALNAARSGNTAHDSVNVLLNQAVLDRPDIALLMHATNDIGLLAWTGGYAQRSGREPGLRTFADWSLMKLSTRLSLVALLRSSTTMVWPRRGDFAELAKQAQETAPLDLAPFVRRLRSFVGIARAFDVEPVLMTQPSSTLGTEFTPAWRDTLNQKHFNRAIRELGRSESVVVIDVARTLEQSVPDWETPMKIFYDGIHVTDEGSRIYAEIITEALTAEVIPALLLRRSLDVTRSGASR